MVSRQRLAGMSVGVYWESSRSARYEGLDGAAWHVWYSKKVEIKVVRVVVAFSLAAPVAKVHENFRSMLSMFYAYAIISQQVAVLSVVLSQLFGYSSICFGLKSYNLSYADAASPPPSRAADGGEGSRWQE